jgi:hypothetical protein
MKPEPLLSNKAWNLTALYTTVYRKEGTRVPFLNTRALGVYSMNKMTEIVCNDIQQFKLAAASTFAAPTQAPVLA